MKMVAGKTPDTKHQMHNLTGLHSSGVPAYKGRTEDKKRKYLSRSISLSYPGVTLLLKKWVSLQWKTPPSGHTDWYLSGAGFGLRHILKLTLIRQDLICFRGWSQRAILEIKRSLTLTFNLSILLPTRGASSFLWIEILTEPFSHWSLTICATDTVWLIH